VRTANSRKVEASGASHTVHMSRAKEVAALIEEVGGWSTLNADHPSARISRVAYLFAFGF
jgi:hypothetical protein